MIAIAGVGGIGSNVAYNLVRAGVGNLHLFDFDTISESNLNRQFYFYDQIGLAKVDACEENLKRISPLLHIQKSNIKLTSQNIHSLLSGFSVIVEGFDTVQYKKELIETFSGTSVFVVSASGIAGMNIDNIKIKKIGSCYVVGDHYTDILDEPIYSYKVMSVACTMSALVLQRIKNEYNFHAGKNHYSRRVVWNYL